MKRKQFSDEQIIGVPKEAEAGAVVTDLCRQHGMSSATCLSLEGQVRGHGGRAVVRHWSEDNGERRQAPASPEDENGKLERLLAGAMLDSEAGWMTVRGTVIPLSRAEGSGPKEW